MIVENMLFKIDKKWTVYADEIAYHSNLNYIHFNEWYL